MRQRVYIETTIPSFFHTLRTDAESVARMNWTRQWWDENVAEVQLATSLAVLAELRRGTSRKTPERLALLNGIELLEVTEEVLELTSLYIEKLVMPNDPAGDALHLALASIHKIDVLLTWNCRHLANPNKLEHIRLINFGLGLPVPTIATPLNFLGGDDHHG